MDNARQYQDLSRFRMPPGFRGRSAVTVQIWWIVQDTLFRWSPQVFYGWRNFLLRLFGAKIGTKVQIRSTTRVTYPWKLTIGDYVWVGDDCVFYNLGEICSCGVAPWPSRTTCISARGCTTTSASIFPSGKSPFGSRMRCGFRTTCSSDRG